MQNTSSHSQSTQQLAVLISDQEMHLHRESYMIKCKQENCLKIKQYWVENYVFVKASWKYYGIERRYYICWKVQLNLFPDGVVPNVKKINSGWPGWLLPVTDELLLHIFDTSWGLLCCHILYFTRHLICAMTFEENMKGRRQM